MIGAVLMGGWPPGANASESCLNITAFVAIQRANTGFDIELVELGPEERRNAVANFNAEPPVTAYDPARVYLLLAPAILNFKMAFANEDGCVTQAWFMVLKNKDRLLAPPSLRKDAAHSDSGAQGICGPRAKLVARLEKTYSEAPASIGLASNGAVIEILASATGSFTIIRTQPNGLACVMAAGENWEDLPKRLAGQGT